MSLMDCTKVHDGFVGEWYNYSELNLHTLWLVLGYVTCIFRMSPKATAAMWTDAKLTKTKSRKISSHLLDWFKQPITAKEPDVDAFGTYRRSSANITLSN